MYMYIYIYLLIRIWNLDGFGRQLRKHFQASRNKTSIFTSKDDLDSSMIRARGPGGALCSRGGFQLEIGDLC